MEELLQQFKTEGISNGLPTDQATSDAKKRTELVLANAYQKTAEEINIDQRKQAAFVTGNCAFSPQVCEIFAFAGVKNDEIDWINSRLWQEKLDAGFPLADAKRLAKADYEKEQRLIAEEAGAASGSQNVATTSPLQYIPPDYLDKITGPNNYRYLTAEGAQEIDKKYWDTFGYHASVETLYQFGHEINLRPSLTIMEIVSKIGFYKSDVFEYTGQLHYNGIQYEIPIGDFEIKYYDWITLLKSPHPMDTLAIWQRVTMDKRPATNLPTTDRRVAATVQNVTVLQNTKTNTLELYVTNSRGQNVSGRAVTNPLQVYSVANRFGLSGNGFRPLAKVNQRLQVGGITSVNNLNAINNRSAIDSPIANTNRTNELNFYMKSNFAVSGSSPTARGVSSNAAGGGQIAEQFALQNNATKLDFSCYFNLRTELGDNDPAIKANSRFKIAEANQKLHQDCKSALESGKEASAFNANKILAEKNFTLAVVASEELKEMAKEKGAPVEEQAAIAKMFNGRATAYVGAYKELLVNANDAKIVTNLNEKLNTLSAISKDLQTNFPTTTSEKIASVSPAPITQTPSGTSSFGFSNPAVQNSQNIETEMPVVNREIASTPNTSAKDAIDPKTAASIVKNTRTFEPGYAPSEDLIFDRISGAYKRVFRELQEPSK